MQPLLLMGEIDITDLGWEYTNYNSDNYLRYFGWSADNNWRAINNTLLDEFKGEVKI
jgi:hypothetical protein